MEKTPTELDPVVQEIKTGIAGIKTDLTEQIAKRDEAIERTGKASQDALEKISALDAALKQAQDDLAGRLEQVDGRVTGLDAKMGRGFPTGHEWKTAGMQFTEHPDYEAAKDGFQKGRMLKLPVSRKALFNAPGMGSHPLTLWEPQRLDPVRVPDRDVHIRSLMDVQEAAAASIQYVRQTSGPWIAGVQNPALEGEPETSAKKTEQTLAFTDEVASAATVAHWIPVTTQALEDAVWLRGWIDGRLAAGLRLAEDNQLLYGSGLNGQVTGLMVDAAVQEYDQADGPATDSPADALRRAITRLRLEYYMPNGIVLNPLAWEEIELTKDTQERYVWFMGPAGIDGEPRIWRVRVVDTPAIDANQYLLGDFRIGATLWDWKDPTITAGTINDDFVRNRLAILGEQRILFTRQLPRAFVRGTLSVAAS
jgi:HK97 family phage major capsid protein